MTALSVYRGEIQTLSLTVTGVNLQTGITNLAMTIRDTAGTLLAAYTSSPAAGITVTGATTADIALNATGWAVGDYQYDVWVDLVGGHKRVAVAPRLLKVMKNPRFP